MQEQSGIVAGSGGFNITVGGNTHLEGGVIGSTADASKNRLDTGSLTVVDIENESRAKTSGGGIGTGMSSGGGISNPLGSAAGAGLSLLGGTKKNDSSTTRSDIAAGTVVVRDGNESALAGLDRTATGFDTDSALSAVDLRKMQERAEVMQLGGQLLFKGVGDLGGYLSQKADTEEGKAFWADGGNGRALLHGMAGAAMAALGGADALKGAVSAAGAEKAKIAISEFLESNKGSLSWEDYQSLMEVGSAMVGGALGGSTGANIAVTGDRFNRQLHPDEVKWINMNAAAFAAQEGISEAEAVRRLTTEGAARVDAKVNRLVGNENVDLEATAFLSKMGGTYGFTATEAEYNNFNLYGKELLKDDALYRQVFNSLLSSGVSKDDVQLKFYDLNNLRGTKIRGGDGWTMMGTFSGDIGAAGSVIASVAKGDGNGAAIGAASFLIPVRLPGAKIVGEVGAEIAGAATKQGVLKSEEILKSVQNAATGTGLQPKAGGNLAGLVGAEKSIAARKEPTRFIDGVTVVDKKTGNVLQGTVDLGPTLDRIKSGGSYPHRNDGSIFQNRAGDLPVKPAGYYTEYVHPTPGVTGPGAQRIVVGKGGEMYYTADHYKTFIPINN
ncbi:ribonuclease domain-containing protein [Stenotrophomonas maltophilia]|uniref:ribonuclease domain-containing protein n=1 Tax=Stenotrophomonas maltophilia TaxID=40324 RepID=UPI000DAA981C|nr:ribonuclease domain-containing protein [Stenotrophomonas maltophilia]